MKITFRILCVDYNEMMPTFLSKNKRMHLILLFWYCTKLFRKKEQKNDQTNTNPSWAQLDEFFICRRFVDKIQQMMRHIDKSK